MDRCRDRLAADEQAVSAERVRCAEDETTVAVGAAFDLKKTLRQGPEELRMG